MKKMQIYQVLRVDNKETCDQRVEVSINTMK